MNLDHLNDIDWYLGRIHKELAERLEWLAADEELKTVEGESARLLQAKLSEICQVIFRAKLDIQAWRSRYGRY